MPDSPLEAIALAGQLARLEDAIREHRSGTKPPWDERDRTLYAHLPEVADETVDG